MPTDLQDCPGDNADVRPSQLVRGRSKAFRAVAVPMKNAYRDPRFIASRSDCEEPEGVSSFCMANSRQMIALLKSHVRRDDQEFLSIAMEMAAAEARQGHSQVAEALKNLIDEARKQPSSLSPKPLLVLPNRSELTNLLLTTEPDTRLVDMVLPDVLASRLGRILLEQRQQTRLREHGLRPRRKILLVGPPGSGKTMTASALAGELHLPLSTILLEGVITKFMGETATKLKLVFDAMTSMESVYFFDEFDAIGAKRTQSNDVGEIRRVLNTFLQLLEKDDSRGLVIAATNHPELLDRALFRRFDDVLEYELPEDDVLRRLLHARLGKSADDGIDWDALLDKSRGLSQADVSQAATDALKHMLLHGQPHVTTRNLLAALDERNATFQK
jgi:SpoVK/Ycf46/Vps4 family AAA+-type ATPase